MNAKPKTKLATWNSDSKKLLKILRKFFKYFIIKNPNNVNCLKKIMILALALLIYFKNTHLIIIYKQNFRIQTEKIILIFFFLALISLILSSFLII